MDSSEFRLRSSQITDCIVKYHKDVKNFRVNPNVEPGYLRPLLPDEPPKDGEDWQTIMTDLQDYILPGITHWQHPQFHAYFPCGNSFPAILGEMLSSAFGAIGFSWAACPVFTELETVMMNWVAKMFGLPEQFLFAPNSEGGGVIQGSASECVLVCLLAARHKKLKQLRKQYPSIEDGVLLSKLVAYTSQEAHSCVEKAAMIGLVKIRQLETDEKYRLRGETLSKAIKKDLSDGLEPFFVSATLGTTSCCSFDDLTELGPICQKEDIWLHVDAAYAGNALICPELRSFSQGLEFANSFNVNIHKWLLVTFDCSLMWVKNAVELMEPLTIDPLYLQHNKSDKAVDYRNWTIPLSRRFRSLKLWFVLRKYGINKLQDHVREHIRLAKKIQHWIKNDIRFELMNEVQTGLVCFRLKGPNHLTETLLYFLNNSGYFYSVPAMLKGRYVIRLSVNSANVRDSDILQSWRIVSQTASSLLQVANACIKQDVDFENNKENQFENPKRPLYSRSFSESITKTGQKRRFLAIIDNTDEIIHVR